MARFAFSDIPDQRGRTVLVTGANSGIGFVTARELARAGARVLLACRSAERGAAAVDAIRAELGDADLALHGLDVSRLASVRAFCEALDEPVDVVVHNAGVMAIPRSLTEDGFETQLATNHLGPFALGGLLFARLRRPARVVTVSSLAAWIGRIRFDDLNGARRYETWTQYGLTKLANQLFTAEAHRRYGDSGVAFLACHPGYARTHLQASSKAVHPAYGPLFAVLNPLFAQSADQGALPTLYAATAPDAASGAFIGPALGAWGRPARALWAPGATPESARRLWEVSEALTGVTWPAAHLA